VVLPYTSGGGVGVCQARWICGEAEGGGLRHELGMDFIGGQELAVVVPAEAGTGGEDDGGSGDGTFHAAEEKIIGGV